MKTKPVILIISFLMMVFGAGAVQAQPDLQAMINHNWISGNGFPGDTEINIALQNSQGNPKAGFAITTDNTGNFWAGAWPYWPNQSLERGDRIQATFDSQTANMTVQNLTATVNIDANTIAGGAFTPAPDNQALAGRKVTVDISDSFGPGSLPLYHGETLIQANGNFLLNGMASSGYQLQRGHAVFLTLFDAADGSATGHRTSIEPYNSIPKLEIWFKYNRIDGSGFPFNSSVTVAINGDSNKTRILQSDSRGNFSFHAWEFNYPMGLGDVITATAQDNQSASVMIPVLPILLSSATADPVQDRIFGDAPALSGQDLLIRIYTNTGPYNNSVTVASGGLFSKDLTDLDILPGQDVGLGVTDASGDIVFFNAYNGPPVLSIMIEHNRISGWEFPPNVLLSIDLSDGTNASFTIMTDDRGGFWANNDLWNHQPLVRGGDIHITWGDTGSVFTEIQNFSATVDIAGNRVTGIALTPDGQSLSGNRVELWATDNWANPPMYNAIPVITDNGVFTFDFNGTGYTLQTGHKLFLTLFQSTDGSNSGNQTSTTPYNGIPRIEVSPDHNWINGSDFPFNSPLILTIDPVNSGTNLTANLTSDSAGNFNKNVFDFNSYHLQPGDVVAVAHGVGQSISVTVPSVTVSVNADTNIISGTAPGFQSIRIVIYSQDHSTLLHEATVNMDENGQFSLEWTGLEPGMQIDLFLTDGNGETITYHGYNPIPTLTAMITHNWIRCDGFPPNTPGTLTIDQGAAGTVVINGQTDENGNAFLEGRVAWPGRNIAIGNVIDAVVGSVHATMTIQDLRATADAAANLITGSAKTPSGQLLSGRRTDVSISLEWGEPELYHQSTTVDQFGNFELNLNGLFDLQVGQKVFLTLTDDPNGNTWGHRTCIAPFNDPKAIRASVTNNNYADGSFKTSFDIYVWSDPGIVIDDMYIDGPGGRLPYAKQDFQGWAPDPTYFWLFIDGPPAIGIYTFHVVSNGIDVTTQDSQNVNRTMPIPDFITPENGNILTTSTPTIEWTAVSHPDTTIYYRLVIDDMNGNRVFSTSRQPGMLSVTVPAGMLQPGQSYRLQIRTSDSNDWIATQNTGRGYCDITIAASSKGDINGDGVIDLADGILALQILAGYPVVGISPDADVNGDGKIGMAEAIYVLQLLGELRQ